MKKELTKSQQGKKNKRDGAKFELLVRKDLEEKGWIVSKWQNNVEFPDIVRIKATENTSIEAFDKKRFNEGRLFPAKHKFCGIGRPMALGTGFPDFIAYTYKEIIIDISKPFPNEEVVDGNTCTLIGVEVKSNGYLDKEEKNKCKWLIEKKVFPKILIARKPKSSQELISGEKIIYEEYKNEEVL
jgi:hypothetical protein